MHSLSTNLHNNQNNHINGRFVIEERRKQVARLLAEMRTETQIAQMLGVDQTTVSRDIKALSYMSQRFVFDLAKTDLPRFYHSCIQGVEAVKQRAWDIVHREHVDDKILIAALKLAKECDIARFELFQSGPNVLNLQSLQSKIDSIEQGNGSINSFENQEVIRTSR
jgi:Trp repressor protein